MRFENYLTEGGINAAFWISPRGEVIFTPLSHIDQVLKTPAKFGLTKADIESVFQHFNEPLGLEGKAREQIMIDLLERGWIRLRRTKNFWIAQLNKFGNKERGYLSKWAQLVLSGKLKYKEDDPYIPIEVYDHTDRMLSNSGMNKVKQSNFNEELKICEMQDLPDMPIIPLKFFRLRNYIAEEQIVSTKFAQERDKIFNNIRKNCSQILDIYKTTINRSALKGGLLYRGLKKKVKMGEVKTGRLEKGRIPKDTPVVVHNWLNEQFKKRFGWSVRDGVPVTTAYGQAQGYGEVYIFFPFNGFKYVYSDEVLDLYTDLPGIADADPWTFDLHEWQLMYKDEIDEIIDSYTNKGLEKLLSKNSSIFGSSKEIMFNTSKYYLMSYTMVNYIGVEEFDNFIHGK